MTNSLRSPAWAGIRMRLDPGHFPQQVSYASRHDSDCMTFTLSKRGAVLRRILPQSGLPLSIALPPRAFKGVAARAIDHGNGTVTVTLELHHSDPDLCVPLLVAHDLSDVAADWRAWSTIYDLPMLMIEADGSATSLDAHPGTVKIGRARPRRRKVAFRKRSSSIRMRRSGNPLGIRLVIDGIEIIARN